MTKLKQLAWVCFLAVTSAGCATKECRIEGAKAIVVPADDECPSISVAQAELEAGKHASGEKVVGSAEKTSHPSGTLCWYRLELDPPCVESNRESVLSSGLPETDIVACDVQGWLYGQKSAAGAAECAATIMPKGPVLTF